VPDDVTIDNGSGTDYDVATDDDGAGNHVQIVKLAQAADGSRTPIAADANGMDVDVTRIADSPTREVGRARIWDGTDEATVIPRDTEPTATDKGLAVVPLKTPRPGYQVVTPEITAPTAIGVTRPLQLWHPSSLAKDVFITEIGVNIAGAAITAGRYAWELSFISAESATGTVITPQQMNRGDAASGLTVRQAVTAETLTGQIFQRATSGPMVAATPNITQYDGVVIFRSKDVDAYSDAITLRNGQAEGLLVRLNIIATLTGVAIFTAYCRFIERA
jgi:hypothetical protein